MSDQIKVGLIIAAAILISTGAYIYFTPYQSCLRTLHAYDVANGRNTVETYIVASCLQQTK